MASLTWLSLCECLPGTRVSAQPHCFQEAGFPQRELPAKVGGSPILLALSESSQHHAGHVLWVINSASPHSQELSWTPGPGGRQGHCRGLCEVGDAAVAICGSHSLLLWKPSPAQTHRGEHPDVSIIVPWVGTAICSLIFLSLLLLSTLCRMGKFSGGLIMQRCKLFLHSPPNRLSAAFGLGCTPAVSASPALAPMSILPLIPVIQGHLLEPRGLWRLN